MMSYFNRGLRNTFEYTGISFEVVNLPHLFHTVCEAVNNNCSRFDQAPNTVDYTGKSFEVAILKNT